MKKREKHKGCSYGGFVGLNDEYIEGIFVSDGMQSCGIGKLLLDYIKDKKERLQLNVYQKNARAIFFTKEKDSLYNVKVWMKLLVKKSTLCYGNKNRNRELWRRVICWY